MKLCASPANTSCTYQRRLAGDQAPNEPDNGASSDAFEELYKFLQEHLDPNDLSEADTLLRHFIDKSGDNNIAADGSVTARAGAAGSARWRFLGSPLDGTTG
jgi:hypothetical protein